LNGLKTRLGTGPWDPTINATAMLSYLNEKYGGKIDYAYSVGNEPNLWPIKVPVEQLAKDAVTLKELLKDYAIGNDVYGMSFGDVNVNEAAAFVPIAHAGGVKGLTVHNYPYARHCNVSSYLQKQPVTDVLFGEMLAVANVTHSLGAENMLLVLEETAGSYGGGCVNITDRFVSGFEWMATLSAAGRAFFHRVHRQDIAGWSFAFGVSNYQLVGPPGWTNGSTALNKPHPDWYTTILWKQLVGTTVLTTSSSGPAVTLNTIDTQFWCGKGDGEVVLAWTNPGADVIDVTLPSAVAGAECSQYMLTSTAAGSTYDTLQVDAVYLNGALLRVDPSTGLLPQNPLPGQPCAAAITLPAYAYGFFVFSGGNVHAAACSGR